MKSDQILNRPILSRIGSVQKFQIEPGQNRFNQRVSNHMTNPPKNAGQLAFARSEQIQRVFNNRGEIVGQVIRGNRVLRIAAVPPQNQMRASIEHRVNLGRGMLQSLVLQRPLSHWLASQLRHARRQRPIAALLARLQPQRGWKRLDIAPQIGAGKVAGVISQQERRDRRPARRRRFSRQNCV